MAWLILYAIGCVATLFLAYVIAFGAGEERPMLGYFFGATLFALSIWLGLRTWTVASHIWPDLLL